MRRHGTHRALLIAALGSALCSAQTPAAETLRYSINWPSGLSLGEAELRTARTAGRGELEFTLNAAIPGFTVEDRYRSAITADGCSLEFEKDSTHGKRKAREKTTFDYRKRIARRSTVEGGKTEFTLPPCARDALAFILFARNELAQGRVPPASTVYFGAAYQVRLDYAGPQSVAVNDVPVQADRILATVKGPASSVNLEIFYARDPGRTPLVVKVPFSLGVFSMELVR
ncbi:MAG: DUF3108 domain-containing protein [Bryobacteraceae bacterium]